MGKEGKVDLFSVIILAIFIFVMYSVLVLGAGLRVETSFPENMTNASASTGHSPSATNSSFNGTNGQFHCNVGNNGSNFINITNVSLYIGTTPGGWGDLSKNQTLNASGANIPISNTTFIFNITTAFNEGRFWWFCRAEDNSSTILYNTSLNRTFTIDKTAPYLTTNVTNTTSGTISTGETIYMAVNFSDQYTTVSNVKLFANISGVADNVVNRTNTSHGVWAGNDTMVNLSYTIPGHLLDDVLNFTFWANDSVGNINISPAVILRVEGDGTPPGITLNKPVHLFNQTGTSIEFNFTAFDNNNSDSYEFTCGINASLGGAPGFVNISNIDVVNGTAQVNATTNISSFTLSNGTYNWNVSCTDGAGNLNTSLSQTFTVDQIPPVVGYYNITDVQVNTTVTGTSGVGNGTELGLGDGVSTAQGRTIFAIANWTDNLTRPFRAVFQFYNVTGSTPVWQTINESPSGEQLFNQSGWANFSFPISSSRNDFEGMNVSFRIIANDTLGNINDTVDVKNFTIQINDTYAPTITINATADGVVIGNDTAVTDITPLISWAVDENGMLKSINVSVDSTNQAAESSGDFAGCNRFKQYVGTPGSGGPTDPNTKRNDSLQISGTDPCQLSNGTHSIKVQAVDIWGNLKVEFYNFTVQSSESAPGLGFNLTDLEDSGTWSRAIVNNTNITSEVGIKLYGSNGLGAHISNVSYFSSCDSTVRITGNNTVVYPFNVSSCGAGSENRILTVTINDTAGNSNTTVLGFLVDNVGPAITSWSPTDDQVFTDTNASLNFSVLDDDQAISFYGYYLDEFNDVLPTTINVSSTVTIGAAGLNTSDSILVNVTPGTHTIKFTANDSLGNVRNSSLITFTQIGPFDFGTVTTSAEQYGTELFGTNITNVTVKIKTDAGTYEAITGSNMTNNTFEILFEAVGVINISITELNGSAANWAKINFTPIINNTPQELGVENNWSNTVLNSTWFNSSITEFISDNDAYYGVVELPFNNTGATPITVGSVEFWWFEDETDLTTKINISQCTGAFSRTSTTPCWNYSKRGIGRTEIYVPHFSMVVAVNDSDAPIVTVNTPPVNGTQTESSFFPNITVSNDAVSCNISYHGADNNGSNVTVTPTTLGNKKQCIGSQLDVVNGTAQNNNMTFYVLDSHGNLATVTSNFNVSDSTPHNVSSVSIGSITTTEAVVTVTANESVNLSIYNSTGATALTATHYSNKSTFAKSQTVSFSSLTASTTYNFTVQSCDKAGNCRINLTLGFKTGAADAETESTTTTTTSSGSGGTTTASTVADSKAQVWSTVPAGSSISLNVDKATIAITSVVVTGVKSKLKNVDLEVASLTEKPVSADAASKVYQYLRINKKNIADADAESFKIGFRVTKAWLTENSLASGDVSLYRYKSGWNELATRVTGTDSTYVNYEADTPGFSSFAIGVKSGDVEGEAPEEVSTEAPEDEGAPEAVETPRAIEAPSKSPVAWVIAAVVIILGIVLIVAYQKQKKQV